MAAALSKFFCALFIAAGGLYALYAFALRKEYRRPFPLAFHGLFSLTLILQGIAFLFYYPFNRFSLLPTMLFITSVYGGAALAWRFDSGKERRAVLLSITAVEVFFALWKLTAFTDLPVIARLPLNVCNILVILLALRCVIKSPVLENYILCFGIIAGLVSYLIGAFYDDNPAVSSFGGGFFYSRMIEATLLHDLFLVYCVYAFLKKIIIVKISRAMQNMLWIVPLFAVFSFCNQIWKTDFFFTGVHGITPEFLIAIYYAVPFRFTLTLGGRIFEVNPLHSLLVLGATSLILLSFSALLSFLQPRIPRFWRGNTEAA